MNTTLKIKQLWEYLDIQDDEILIVRSYNQETKEDEYLIVEEESGWTQNHNNGQST